MAICYDKLWKLLIDKKMNRTELKEASGISFNVLARMGKNEPVSFESIEKICFTLNCKIEDVVEIKKEKPIQVDSNEFTTIELFAGAGGLALGIEKAGFEALGLIEFDKDAAESLQTNRPKWRVIHDDIANISCLDLEEYFGIKKGQLDLLSGGAPCQAFSYAGKRLGLSLIHIFMIENIKRVTKVTEKEDAMRTNYMMNVDDVMEELGVKPVSYTHLYYHQIYGLIQDFTVENAWKCCLMMNGFRPEWK